MGKESRLSHIQAVLIAKWATPHNCIMGSSRGAERCLCNSIGQLQSWRGYICGTSASSIREWTTPWFEAVSKDRMRMDESILDADSAGTRRWIEVDDARRHGGHGWDRGDRWVLRPGDVFVYRLAFGFRHCVFTAVSYYHRKGLLEYHRSVNRLKNL